MLLIPFFLGKVTMQQSKRPEDYAAAGPQGRRAGMETLTKGPRVLTRKLHLGPKSAQICDKGGKHPSVRNVPMRYVVLAIFIATVSSKDFLVFETVKDFVVYIQRRDQFCCRSKPVPRSPQLKLSSKPLRGKVNVM